MFTLHPTNLLSLSTLFFLLSPSIAQENSTSLSTCPFGLNGRDPDARVNTTGTQPFRFANPYSGDADWYLSVTLNDTRDPILTFTLHDIQGYLSVPEGVEANACVYMYTGLDAIGRDGENGCDGLLSVDCINLLKRDIRFPVQSAIDQSGRWRCQPPAQDDAIREACGNGIFQQGIIFTSNVMELANTTCTVDHPPSVDIPEGYDTHPAMGMAPAPSRSDRLAWNYTWYDRYVRRPIPFVIAGSFNDNSQLETQVVCKAPSRVLSGSREPEGNFPENPAQSAGVCLSWRVSDRLAWITASLVAMAVMLM